MPSRPCTKPSGQRSWRWLHSLHPDAFLSEPVLLWALGKESLLVYLHLGVDVFIACVLLCLSGCWTLMFISLPPPSACWVLGTAITKNQACVQASVSDRERQAEMERMDQERFRLLEGDIISLLCGKEGSGRRWLQTVSALVSKGSWQCSFPLNNWSTITANANSMLQEVACIIRAWRCWKQNNGAHYRILE